jgi:hypothetical protein
VTSAVALALHTSKIIIWFIIIRTDITPSGLSATFQHLLVQMLHPASGLTLQLMGGADTRT